ncbi:hypothetical protein MPSEU_000739300 [Mayamaea pseudoterrestris]|nr:hypothetical protein MPSEU_000739300 [Mayamaea pseudoterrestris]
MSHQQNIHQDGASDSFGHLAVNHVHCHHLEDDPAEALLSPATPLSISPNTPAYATLPASASAESHDHHGSTSPWIPPVAPAVLVVEERGNDGDGDDSSANSNRSGRYAYPVATFVRDLVRTGMENVHNVRIAASAHATDVAVNTGRTANHLMLNAMQSEPALYSGSSQHSAMPVTAYSARDFNMPMALNDDAEFILVDGDLIAIPPPPNAMEQEGIEAMLHQQSGANRACRPTRFRRGVRKLNKLFRRKREDKERLALPPQEIEAITSSLSTATMTSDAAIVPTVTSITQSESNQSDAANINPISRRQAGASIGDPSPTTSTASSVQSKKNRKKMLTWRQPQQPLSETTREGADFRHEQFANAAASTSGLSPFLSETPFANGSANVASAAYGTATASFVGTADQLLEADVLGASMSAEAYVEFDDPYSKKDEGSSSQLMSLVPRDADYKVDKADALDVESMLRRAAYETTNDIDMFEPTTPLLKRQLTGKTTGSSIPLSLSCAQDDSSHVHNDMLKVVMVGCLFEKTWLARAIRDTAKRPRKRSTLGVDVHTWSPADSEGDPIKLSIWDVQGTTSTLDGCPNFGGHPATQSLFFSGQTLYILVYDLAINNPKTQAKRPVEFDYDDEDDDYDDEFVQEEADRRADRALQADIQSRVLSWVQSIAKRGPKSAILPVAVVPESMNIDEARRRSIVMQSLIEEYVDRIAGDADAPKLLTGEEDVLCVRYSDGQGIEQLREMIYAIATDKTQSVFEHVGTPVPAGTAQVYDMIRRLKQDHKLILVDHLFGEVDKFLDFDGLVRILEFLDSIGEILYYSTGDEVLSRYVILSRKWLVSALSCILRNDLNRELEETRRFMNMQCLYSSHKFQENDIVKMLASGTTSSCPLLSDSDANMLWQSMSFMREAADHYSQLDENSTTAPSMFYFLERLLVHSGIFVPLGINQASLDKSEVFFVPSILAQVDARDIWSFKSSDSWMCVLSNSWLFRQGAPSNLMEILSVDLLKGLFSFSKSFQPICRPQAPKRAKTVPIRGPSFHEFYEDHDDQIVGRVRIHQIMCWQTSMLVKIGTVFADKESDQLRESFVEILVTVVDQTSNICVASDAMRSGMHRVIVSGKGQVGHHGRKLWEGGYQVVLDSIRSTLESYANVDAQIVCPECLAHSLPHSACTWSQDSVLAVAEGGSALVRCMRGHRVDSNLICGRCRDHSAAVTPLDAAGIRHAKPVSDMLASVVLVGLYDPHSKCIASVGSGFIVDRKHGLIVTAGHVVFDMEGRHFGTKYFGIKDAKVVIGLCSEVGDNAVFRYFAEVVADDIHNVDATVLQIYSRMENDVDDDGPGCAGQSERKLGLPAMQDETLRSLKLTTRYELEEAVRILGFNQGGEGIFEKGKHINRSFDFAKGYVCKIFRASMSDDSSHSSDSSSHCTFTPREEIVVMCPTISGHSGGPCVNDDGKVVGILSRADPVDRQRCYIVPANEIKGLVAKARTHVMRSAASNQASLSKSI